MARIVFNRLNEIQKERNTIHQEVQASYTVFEKDGKQFFQIDTYGRDNRMMPEKISQSIQIDKEMAGQLVNLLKQTFKL